MDLKQLVNYLGTQKTKAFHHTTFFQTQDSNLAYTLNLIILLNHNNQRYNADLCRPEMDSSKRKKCKLTTIQEQCSQKWKPKLIEQKEVLTLKQASIDPRTAVSAFLFLLSNKT